MKFRKLKADEIDCRVAMIKSNGLSLLLYKDARCDMNILDEEVGAMNWQRSHSRDNANCTVSIWDNEKQQWISKEDTGTESFSEKEKGIASDSFKRACFNWGIGRELYTAPFIWISSTDCEIKKNDNGKYSCFTKFFVSKIGYDKDGKINALEIVNEKTNRVIFKLGKAKPPAEDFSKIYATDVEKKTYMDMCNLLGVDSVQILKRVGWKSGKMTAEQHGKALIILKEIEESKNEVDNAK